MLARLILILVTLTGFVVSEQTSLISGDENRYHFKVINYSTSRSGIDQVSPVYQGPTTVRTPFIYRNTTWSKPLNDAQKAAVITAATLPWRDSADSSNAYMEVILLSNAQGYFAFSTDWHIFSGVISSSATLEEFVTDIVPVCLENGVLRGLMEFIDVV
ncbi:hypothetical protein BKA57DRAFT_510583 [Linnemannia elongata]|nr:hypothetical protein BKA57DRAFT_510583 [Linnemannia elongata]